MMQLQLLDFVHVLFDCVWRFRCSTFLPVDATIYFLDTARMTVVRLAYRLVSRKTR